jgi:hypothetical protein
MVSWYFKGGNGSVTCATNIVTLQLSNWYGITTSEYMREAWHLVYCDSKPGVNLIKLIWSKITYTFGKQDHFINIINICSIEIKRSSLQNRESKFMPKKFYEIDPRCFYGAARSSITTISISITDTQYNYADMLHCKTTLSIARLSVAFYFSHAEYLYDG